jgi:hypothetical protein
LDKGLKIAETGEDAYKLQLRLIDTDSSFGSLFLVDVDNAPDISNVHEDGGSRYH